MIRCEQVTAGRKNSFLTGRNYKKNQAQEQESPDSESEVLC